MYYAEYQRLMKHWHEVLPLTILDVDYESIVQRPDSEIRRIIDFCELDWHDTCLTFHETSRAVRTRPALRSVSPVPKSSPAGRTKRPAGAVPSTTATTSPSRSVFS